MADKGGRSLFESSDLTRADLKNLLSLALQRVECNIYLAQLVIWVFNVSSETNPLRKSYRELASRPWGLCCSENHAYATVKKAKRLQLVNVTETWSAPGVQGANEYRMDWDGVRRIVGLRQSVTHPTIKAPPPTIIEAPPTTLDPPPISIEAPLSICDHIEEYTSSLLYSPLSSPSSRGGAAADDSAWNSTRQRLLELGVYVTLVDELIDLLSSRGGTPLDAAMLAEQFAARQEDFGVGALANALKHWQPGQPYNAVGLWPEPAVKQHAAGKWMV